MRIFAMNFLEKFEPVGLVWRQFSFLDSSAFWYDKTLRFSNRLSLITFLLQIDHL